AGKTTTISAILGIHAFEGVEILINGMSIKSHPIECKKSMAYIPDSPDLYEFMSGNRYLNFVANMYDLPMEQRKERIEKYSRAFEIEQDLSSSISSYSHGMKQKVALIAALIHKPKLLVLDEPFVGLDPKAAYTLKEYFHEIASEGCSIFFSTHVLEVAQKLCNKIAIIKSGKLIEYGKTEDVVGNKSLEDVFLGLTEGVSEKNE
ncbi:MAG: ABC transporter ATP-binding protein, partial [Clostridiales bacterium]|nr:ABC transporter ATP-binding protein [Clostridiales bacterium]